MLRWKLLCLGLALSVATVAGCTQTCYVSKDDMLAFHQRVGLPPNAVGDTTLGTIPKTTNIEAPPDVNHPERDPRYITLNECIALALENGVTGLRSVRSFGNDETDLLGDSQGSFVPRTDSIRILAMEPAIAGASIEAQLARFDVTMRGIAQYITADQNELSPSRFQNGQTGQFGMSFEKPLADGGLASINLGSPTNGVNSTLGSIFNNIPNQVRGGVPNPSYTPDLRFSLIQPLWQGSGTEYNQIAPVHPNSNQTNSFGVGGNSAFQGILIARLRYDQNRAELERNVAFLLVNVETAYWNLYGSFVSLYSSEQALRQAYEAWRISKAKYEAGSVAITQFAQTRGQYEQFRGDRITALGQVLEAERTLRHLLGLTVEDGKRLVPVDSPTLTPYVPNWQTAANEALALRPELVQARTELKNRQLEVIRIKNQLLPTLNLNSTYAIHGFGNRLDGDGVLVGTSPSGGAVTETSNAFRSLAGLHNSDYTVGLTFSMPLGFRFASAQVRQAELRLAQGYQELKDQETRALFYLRQQYGFVAEKYKVIQARRSQRLAFAEQVEARFKEFVAGKTTADFLLEAQRQWAASLSSEYQEVVNYNNALARFQFAKGTMLQHDNVVISEGDLPQCAQVRAVEHERERTASLVIRERAAPVPQPNFKTGPGGSALPKLPMTSAPPLPSLIQGAPTVPDEKVGTNALFETRSNPETLEVHDVPALGVNDPEALKASQPRTAEPAVSLPANDPPLAVPGSADALPVPQMTPPASLLPTAPPLELSN